MMTIGYNPFDEDFSLEDLHEYRAMAISLREENLRLKKNLKEYEDKIGQGTLKEIPENAVVLTKEEYRDLKTYERLFDPAPWCTVGICEGVCKECKSTCPASSIVIARKETVKKFAERLKKRFMGVREYQYRDTGTAWGEPCIGGLINNTIEEIEKEIMESE